MNYREPVLPEMGAIRFAAEDAPLCQMPPLVWRENGELCSTHPAGDVCQGTLCYRMGACRLTGRPFGMRAK